MQNLQDISAVLNLLKIDKTNSGAAIGHQWLKTGGGIVSSLSPVDGSKIADVTMATKSDYESVILAAQEAYVQMAHGARTSAGGNRASGR